MPFDSKNLADTIQAAFDDVLGDDGEPPRLNETETRTHLIDPALRALGYTSFANFRQEFRLKASGQHVDYLLIAGSRRVVVEAKAASNKLAPKDSGQLVGYCAQEGIRWALLTNGIEWHIFDVNLSGDWEAKRVTKLDFFHGYRSTRGLGELAVSLAYFARGFLSDGDNEVKLDAWSQSTRARGILMDLISTPSSALIETAAKELADRGIHMESAAVLDLLHEGLVEGAVDPIRTIAEPPPQPSSGARPAHPHTDPRGAAYYLLTASAQGGNDGQMGLDVLKELLGFQRWGIRTKTGLRTELKHGDRCCFFAAKLGVVAKAEVAGPPSSEPAADGYFPVMLSNVHWLDAPIALDAKLRRNLDAFNSKESGGNWSWFVQRSIRKLTAHDYSVLTGKAIV